MNLTKAILTVTILISLGFIISPAEAQYKMIRSSLSTGSSSSSNGNFRITGTLSQTGIGISENNQHQVLAGFWYRKPADFATSIDDTILDVLPASYQLEQNFPNPFNPSTNIRFSLPQSSIVKLTIFNLLGQRIVTLVDSELQAGEHSIIFDAARLASGMYLYRLQAGEFSQVKRLTLLK